MTWLVALILSSFLLLSPSPVRAIECGDPLPTGDVGQLDEYIRKCNEKISVLQEEQGTLNAAISTLNSKISLAQGQIAQTEAQIVALEEEIGVLSTLLTDLNFSLDDLSTAYVARVRESYKQRNLSPIYLLFSSQGFADFLEKARYLSVVKARDHLILLELEKARSDYDNQKQVKEDKQVEIEALMAELESEKRNLDSQKAQKQDLLAVTKNSEREYQSLLAEAQSELSSLRGFSAARGDTCLGSPQPQPDGWFWSQRDSRWCGQTIGNSSETVGSVGCLISSVAMVWQKYGHSMTPQTIAQNSSYFFANTAYMLTPPSPPGYSYSRLNYYDSGLIDSELSAGRVVIVHLNLGGDGHFVVIKSGSGGNYTINDPWYGPDIALNDHYSTSNIDSMRFFK